MRTVESTLRATECYQRLFLGEKARFGRCGIFCMGICMPTDPPGVGVSAVTLVIALAAMLFLILMRRWHLTFGSFLKAMALSGIIPAMIRMFGYLKYMMDTRMSIVI